MEAILEILRDDGSVQVSQDGGIGFGLSTTGNVTLVDDGAAHPQPMVVAQVTVQGVIPIMAFKSTGRVCIERVGVNGSSFTFYLRAQSGVPIGLQYWIFDTSAAAIKDATMSDIEAALYDQFGVKTFDFTNSWMRVVGTYDQGKHSGAIPTGTAVNLNSTTNVTVPTGRVYAIAQAHPAFILTTYDTGGFSNSETRPNTPIIRPDDPGEGGGMRWRQQQLQSYQATGGYIGGNQIEVGLTRFENFNLGWMPAGSTPFCNVYGQARHMLLDVTNFVSAGAIDPTAVIGNVNATTRTVTTGGAQTIAQSVTPTVTASASGGAAPYSYEWQFVGGSDLVWPNGLSNQATFSTRTTNQPAASDRQAIYRCRITDANGYVGFTPDVTFTHTVSAYSADVTPDPVATLAAIAPSTPNPIAYGTPRSFRITGITAPVTLRISRAAVLNSGNLVKKNLTVWTSNDGVNFTVRSTLTADTQHFDLVVNNGQYVQLTIEVETSAGVARAAWNVTVSNQSTGGSTITTMAVDAIVDNDNNHNVGPDLTPDPFSYTGSLSLVTNEPTIWNGGQSNVGGITAPVTLRVERYGFTGTLDQAAIHVYLDKRDGQGWQHQGSIDPRLGGLRFLDVVVQPGWAIHTPVQATTNGGRQDASFQLVIWNLSVAPNYQVVAQNVSITVDADNNHNLPTYGAAALNFTGLTTYPTEHPAPTSHSSNTVTLSGPNRPVTLRFLFNYNYVYVQAKNQVGNGHPDNWTNTSSSGALYIFVNGQYRGACSHGTISGTGANGATGYAIADVVVAPGDQIRLSLEHPDPVRLGDGYGGTLSHVAGNIAVDNLSVPGQRLASFSHNNLARGIDFIRPGGGGGPDDPFPPIDPGGPIIIQP